MSNKEHDIAIAKWIEGTLSDQDFAKEVGQENFLKYKQILSEVDRWTPANLGYLPDIKAIKSNAKQSPSKVVSLWGNAGLWVAASIAILLVSVFVLLKWSSTTKVTAMAGEVKRVVLPDGASVIYLSVGSTASWDEDEWNDEHRELTLDGKAYFEVEKGSTFVVHGQNAWVTVLGTKFEFQEYGDQAEVVCYEGRVRAETDAAATIVSAGMASVLEYGQWQSMEMPDGELPAWIQGQSTFKNAPLIKVIQTLEKEYALQVDYKKIKLDRQFTGAFPNDNLTLALKLVFTPLQIKYTLEGEKLILSE